MKRKNIDVSALRLDMQVIGIDNTLMQQLDDLCDSEAVTEEVKPVVLTKEQKVRQLEDNYKEVSKGDRNSRKSIEAYLEWHKETLLYLSCYYSDMNSDFKEFKNLDNSGNGHSLYSNFNKIYAKYNLLMSHVSMQSKDNSKKEIVQWCLLAIHHKIKNLQNLLLIYWKVLDLIKKRYFVVLLMGMV